MFLSTFRHETGRCSSCVFAMQLTTFAILIFDKWIGHANNACAIRPSAHTDAWASASACSFRVSRLYQSHLPALYQKGKINKKNGNVSFGHSAVSVEYSEPGSNRHVF